MGRGADSDPYRRLFETMLDGAVVVDSATARIVLANRAAAGILGCASPDSLIGADLLDYVPREDRERVSGLVARGLAGGLAAPPEFRAITADRREIWLSATSAPVEHRGRKATLTTFRDVTADRLRRNAPDEEERQYRQLFDGMLEGAVVLDIPTFRITLASKAAAAMFGFATPEEVLGENPLDYIPEDDRDRVVRLIASNLDGTDRSPAELRMLTRDKRQIWISATAAEVDYKGQKATLTTMRDITAEKAREAAFREVEHQYRSLFDDMIDGALVLDIATLTIILANKAAAAMFGFATIEEMIGQATLDYIPEEDREAVASTIASNVEGKARPVAEVRVRAKDGRTVWVSASAAVVTYEGRTALMTTMRDITAEKAKDAALTASEESKMQLIEAAKEIILVIQDDKIAYINPSGARGIGLPQQQIMGLPFLDFVHPDSRQDVIERYEKLKSGNFFPAPVTFKGVTAGGETRWSNIQEIPFQWRGRPAVMSLIIDITEQMLAEEALKTREALLRTVVENAWDGVAVFDDSYNVLFESPTLSRITGYTPDEWKQTPPMQWPIHPDDVPLVADRLVTVRKTPNMTVGNIRFRVRCKDGSYRWMEASARNLLHDPNVKGIVTNFRDITEGREAEQALRDSETLLRNTQELAMVGGWEYNVADGQTRWTDETYRIHEIPNLPGIDHMAESLKCYPPMDRQVVKQALQRCIEEGVPYDLVLPFTTFKGNRRWVRTTARAVREDGRTVRVVGNIADVTERKAAEEALLASEERYRKVVDNASEAVAVLQDGLIKFANPKTASVSGYTIAELTQKPFLELVHPDDRKTVSDYYVAKQRGKESPSTYQFRFLDKAGTTGWAEANVTLIIWDGRLATLFLMNIITERKLMEEALRDREARYRGLFEGMQTGIEVISVETGLVVLSNSAAARMFGYASPDELTGLNYADFTRPEDLATIAEKMDRVIRENRRDEVFELPLILKDGRQLWVSATAAMSEYEGKPALLVSLIDITWRKLAEESLRASEEKYRFIVDSTSDYIWTMDLDLRTTYASPSVMRILGFTPEERLAQEAGQQTTPESLARLRKALADCSATEGGPGADASRTITIEMEYYRKDGSTVWVENQIGGVRDAEGRLVAFHGVSRDVSDRRKAQQALRESEERYRFLAENASDVIWIVDANLNVTYVSPSVSHLLGYAIEEVVTHALDRLLTPESLAVIAELYMDDMFSEEKTPGSLKDRIAEFEVRRKDGSTVWLEAAIKTVRDTDGRFAGFQGACRDITQRRRAEAALKASEERFRTLIEESSDAIAILDETGKVLYQTPSMAQVTGYLPDEWQGSPVEDWFLHPDDMPAVAATYERVLREPNSSLSGLTARFKHADGTWHTLEATVRNLLHDPKVGGLVINYRDVTERVKSQEALLASEANYKNLFDATLLGTEVIDAETGKVVLANTAVARIFGLDSPEDAIGISPMDYILPEDRDWVAEQMATAMTAPGKRDVATIRSGTRDGRIVWLTATAASFEYQGRRAILVSMIDVTAMREAEAKLRESEEKNRLLIDNAAEAIAVIQDGATKFFNRRLMELTGCTEEELYRISFLDLVHPEEKDQIALNYMNRIAGLPVPNNYQFRIVDRRGETRWLQVNSVRLNWEDKPATLTMFGDVTEQVKAEQALRDSEERFRALIENASEAIMIINAEAKVVYWSPSITRATGYQFDDWMGKSPTDWKLHPDDLSQILPLLEETLNHPERVLKDLKVRYMHDDGTWHTLECTIRNMLHDPKIGGIVANFRDITERVKGEQAVKESEERYRLLAENVSDVIYVIDMNLKPTYISPSAVRMLGYTPEQFMGGSVEAMLTPQSARVALKAFSKALSRETDEPGATWAPPPLDLEMVRADGSTIWTAANFSYIRGADGKPVAMLGVVKDISERKKAEDELRRSEERFRSLVETSSDWVWEIDAGSRYTYVSPKVRDILGHEPQELLGHTPFEFMHQREGRRVSKIMRRFATERLPFSLLENTATHKDGHPVVLESSAVPIMDSSGRLVGYRGINRDITERKKVEQELQRSLRRLEKTMESTIEAITTTIETRDPYTTGHQMRVTDLACAIAKVMEVPPSKIEGIRVAGLLHDIGKIAVPTEILSKPGKLNEVEYEMIKTHAKIGYNILKKIEFPWPVARTVLQHHERWNGSGYPYGIRGEDILLEARILAVADVMEAMSSHRPYRPSIGADKALDEISKNSGILYDPAVASACITAFSESGFEFASSVPGVVGEADMTPSERHVHYSLEDH